MKLLFTEESLPDLKWEKKQKKKAHTGCVHLRSPPGIVQNLVLSISLPGEVLDVQDAGKSTKLHDTGLHNESQVDKES